MASFAARPGRSSAARPFKSTASAGSDSVARSPSRPRRARAASRRAVVVATPSARTSMADKLMATEYRVLSDELRAPRDPS